MLLKLAWRNIWRNGRRTTITVLALAMGVMSIVSIHSFREVASEDMVRGLTKGMVGHVQVHGRGYQESPEMTTVVADANEIEVQVIRALPGAQTEKRVVGAGLAGAADTSTAVIVMGIEPDKPGARELFHVEKGQSITAATPRGVMIGNGLATQLGVSPGSEVVLVGQAADGSLANDRFTVLGIGDAGSYDANMSAVFLNLPEAQSFFALEHGVHQIIVRLPNENENLAIPVAQLRAGFSANALEVLSWDEILPEFKSAMDAKAKNQRIVDIIVFFIVSLGVLNTMTMSTFERTREFGVMASLGTRRGRILGMVVLEAFLLGVVGFAIGVALAFAILHGIGTVSFASMGGGGDVMGARMPDMVRLRVLPGPVVGAAFTTLLTMLAGGLLPALRAAHLQPVEATRYV